MKTAQWQAVSVTGRVIETSMRPPEVGKKWPTIWSIYRRRTRINFRNMCSRFICMGFEELVVST
jgi:hypothetical protein